MKTKVFISWSGKDTSSFEVAKKLAGWLPKVLQNTEPFMSDNIYAGSHAIAQIMDNLANSKVGIICITKNNINSPWLNFEVGALNNVVTTQSGVVIPILIDMTTDEFSKYSSPINNLQGKVFNKEGIKHMLISINTCLEYPLQEKSLDDIFEVWSSSLFSEKKSIHLSPYTPFLSYEIAEESTSNNQNDTDIISERLLLLRKIASSKSIVYSETKYKKLENDLKYLESNGYIVINTNDKNVFHVTVTSLGTALVNSYF
ncbi:MAG: toll/interleukin-1 receptor domain-containing protein [Ruminococcus sp.]|nr:toll/interleukin-1 receptor domain-containing protein [Ruminococcus sp.]